SRSRIFLIMASNRLTFELAGWPSSSPSGLTNDTAGSVLLDIAVNRSVTSLMCAARWAGSPIIDVTYWNGLQIWQYARPTASSGLRDPFARLTAALKAPP